MVRDFIGACGQPERPPHRTRDKGTSSPSETLQKFLDDPGCVGVLYHMDENGVVQRYVRKHKGQLPIGPLVHDKKWEARQ